MPPWERGSTSKFPLALFSESELIFYCCCFSQQSARISPQEIWTPTKALSSMGSCLSQHSTDAPWLRLRGAGAGSQVIPRCVCPMPDAQVGKTSWVPWQMVLGPKTPTESHFVHRWMPNHNCKKRRQKGGMSYAMMILTSLLKVLFFYSYLKLLANVYSRAKSKQLLIYKKVFLF